MHNAFTVRYSGLVNQLLAEIKIIKPQLGPQDRPKFIQVKAIWDTGATGSVITEKIVNILGLAPIGKVTVAGVHGEQEVNQYLVDIILMNNVRFPEIVVTSAKSFSSGCHALIGMDIIGAGDFAVSKNAKGSTMSFVVPTINEIDFVPGSQEANFKEKTKGLNREQRRQAERDARKKGELPPRRNS